MESDDDKYDYPLAAMEEEQYEEYQEQLYHQQHHSQSQSQSSQHHHQQQQQQQQQQCSSTHRQFNLTPLYDDEELVSVNKKKGGRQNEKGERQQKNRMKDSRSRDTRPLSQEGGSTKGNPLEYNGRVLAYLDSESETEDRSRDNSDDSVEEGGGGTRRHEEFYTPVHHNYGDDDEDDEEDEDDDEERPLRKSRSSNKLQINRDRPQSILSGSEMCLNRTLVLAFAIIFFLFIRDRTPWWKEHERRVALQKHHHHHFLDNTDDDDLETTKIDPMAVYNSNDDDSTHTRDHDPLNKYEKYTKGEPDPSNKYDEATAGERISNRPGSKSLHHGFMDETYSNRPEAKNSGSTAAMQAGVRKDGSSSPGQEIDEEKAAFLESVMRSPTKKNAGGHTGGSSNAVDGGGEGKEEVSPPPPLPPSSNYELTLPSSTGSDLGDSSGISSPEHDNLEDTLTNQQGGLDSQKSLPSYPLPSIDETSVKVSTGSDMSDISGESSVYWGEPKVDASFSTQETMSGSSSYEATSNGSVSSANPQNAQVKEMAWDGNEVGDVATAQIAADPNEESTPPPSKENTLTEAPPSSSNRYQPIMNQAVTGEEVKSVYKDSYYRWNHPFRPGIPGDDGKDVPVFWRIPRSASGTVEAVMSFCYRMVLANSMGTLAGHDRDETLAVMTVGNGADYVNVDMSRPVGIERAKGMSLGSSGLADIISTPFLFETADIFRDIPEAGKCFTLLRHPVDRAISLYHHYQIDESGNPNTAQYRGMTIDDYADQAAENNWMVRFLANKRSGSLNWHDLEVAKEVFGRKCLIGLVDKAEESLRRYERFFQWDKKVPNSEAKDTCLQQYLANGDTRKEHPTYEGTAAWETLRKKNEYDCLLYEFAEKLYTQQSTIYED